MIFVIHKYNYRLCDRLLNFLPDQYHQSRQGIYRAVINIVYYLYIVA